MDAAKILFSFFFMNRNVWSLLMCPMMGYMDWKKLVPMLLIGEKISLEIYRSTPVALDP
jgi:hypothetical protein